MQRKKEGQCDDRFHDDVYVDDDTIACLCKLRKIWNEEEYTPSLFLI